MRSLFTFESWKGLKEMRSFSRMNGDITVWFTWNRRKAERIWVRATSRFSIAVWSSSSKAISLSLISSQCSVRSVASASLHTSWKTEQNEEIIRIYEFIKSLRCILSSFSSEQWCSMNAGSASRYCFPNYYYFSLGVLQSHYSHILCAILTLHILKCSAQLGIL